MSYDLLAFKPGAQPADRVDFIAWFAQVVRLRDGHLRADPAETDPALLAWQRDMSRVFPSQPTRLRASAQAPAESDDELMGADYRFGPQVVYARLDWRLSRKAQAHALKLARQHHVGLFDASGDRGAVWTVMPDGQFLLAHRGETIVGDAKHRHA